jgi:radical SAM protein with 4Fe4S-binding SPASM domain
VAVPLTDKLLNRLHLRRGNGKNPLVSPPAPGLYHYQYQGQGESSRVHLRLDADRRGILLINASRVLHLNETAAFMAFLALEKASPEQAVKSIRKSYAISAAQALEDYTQFVSQIDELVRPDGACPIHDLELELTAPFSARPSAPYRMDLALTYRCNDDCAHCYNARSRDFPEMPASDWKRVLNQLWDLGIPHVVFTGGEPTLRDDLPELVAHAQQLGQICGLNTNARRLSDPAFLQRLVEAGLDHVQITLESHDSEIHDAMVRRKGAWNQTVQGLKNALDSRLFVMTNTTLLQDNSPFLEGTLDFLGKLGVPTIGLNALIHSGRGLTVGKGLPESALPPLLALAQQQTLQFGQRLIWYTPTQYCNFDPMQLELGVKGCTAALYNMCIEPNGDVLPCQSFYQPVGNILQDEWSAIWNHNLCIRLRERQGLPEKCQGCALLAECGGGCPLVTELHPATINIVTPT